MPLAHTEKEIAYYLDRLDIIDETVAQGYEVRPLHRAGYTAAIASLERLDEKILVFGEPDAKPMGYGRAPKMPSCNLQNVVDVEVG